MATTRRGSDEDRERQAWRMPVQLVDFLKREAKAHDDDVTHFAMRIFRAHATYYDLPRSSIVALDVDREALRMTRWDYYVHAFDQRARHIGQKGPGFDAPSTITHTKAAADPKRIRLERWQTGEKVVVSWYLPGDQRKFLRDEAEKVGWDLTPFATALLNAYASFFPIPEARAERLERDRLAAGLDRWEYFRHVWSQREELLGDEGPGFDGPEPSRGGRSK